LHEFTTYILRKATAVTSHIGSLDLEELTRYRGVPRAEEFNSYSREFQELQD
jgi:hypothetical protein